MATFMEPSNVKYQFVETIEPVEYYVPGGYHPVTLGDELCSGQYIIADKLGWGRYATTWLAKDTNEGRLLTKAEFNLPGKVVVQSLLDSFDISGPNGTHRCSLIPLPASRAIAAQLVHGVQFIHSRGIVHGDLHQSDILFRLPPSLENMTFEQLRAVTGEPINQPVVREDGVPLGPGVPSELVMPLGFSLDSDKVTLKDAPLIIADFGKAFKPRDHKQYYFNTPLLLAPPESRFANAGTLDEPLSFPSDIWTLACTVWDVFRQRPPFESFHIEENEVTMEQVEMLGELPKRWWIEWKDRRNWFDEDGIKNVREDLKQLYWHKPRGWEIRFEEYIRKPRQRNKLEMFSADEERDFRVMMNLMLVLEPGERATIDQVVAGEWMQR
ncbi:kinase-like domain-containing protein [Aspergillus filifer]